LSARALPGPPCSVGVALASLEPFEATELADLLAAGARLIDLSDLLVRRGHEVSAFSLGWHRRGRCSCARRRVAA
jgi:hypothetical protein